jgi:hypothetical protein
MGSVASYWSASGRCHGLPDGEGSATQKSMIDCFQQVASQSKEILDDAVKGEKPLALTGRFESAHLTFPLAGRLMRDFGAIVGVAFRVVRDLA